jgi:Tol biopolymer transport system component
VRLSKPFIASLALAVSLAAIAAAAPAQQGETMSSTAAEAVAATPLIPREALYGNPTRSSGMVSPDGKWLSWMAPHEGVMNVWMAPASDPSAAKRMTDATDRPIPQYFWAPDAQSLLYVQDKDGDENYLLYQVDIATGAERVLTPFENTRVQIVGTSNTIKDKVLVGLNNRDPRFHDVHLLDLGTG